MSYRCLALILVLLPFSLEGKSCCHVSMAGPFLFFTKLITLKAGRIKLSTVYIIQSSLKFLHPWWLSWEQQYRHVDAVTHHPTLSFFGE